MQSYFRARSKIPKDANFMIFGCFTCHFKYAGDESAPISKTTCKHNSKNTKDFIDGLYGLFGLDYASADRKTLTTTFMLTIIPNGGKASECREYNSIQNQK